ncbi:hypothetical protein CEP54_014450 [Fusarium duplospermum]|uniref:Uncharacterized protein n=1 Tax=Fusarium duplospermum TaxID=1325734 RepID=A0A428NW81_9HYPO|nr:hypothetical protein CEP54_014450 [Fusarium duplospermum]
MSSESTTAAHQALYRDALRRGRRLLAELRHGSQPPAVHTPISNRYYIKNGESSGEPRMSTVMQRMLRAENVDTNRMAWSEVYSRPKNAENGHITMTKSDLQSSMFIVDELRRANDTSIPGTESRISEILWHSKLGRIVVRMLIDHRSEHTRCVIRRIMVVGGDSGTSFSLFVVLGDADDEA